MSDEDESMGSSDDEDPYFGYPIEDDDEPEVKDPEYFEYSSLKIENVEMLLNENVGYLKDRLKITPSQAKLLLHMNKWEKELIEEKYLRNRDVLLVDSHLIGANVPQPRTGSAREICPVCYRKQATVRSLSCKEEFCVDCWNVYFEEQIRHGISTGIECMGYKCHILAPEDFILSILRNPDYRLKYQKFAFADYVKSHPQLRFCPGKNCDSIVQAKVPEAKRVECSRCSAMFCFLCGLDYHAPTSCNTIKQWITKCADDSETANYISANTKDCPRCHVCIEKNGGCNHMQCTKCRYEFCWMCLGDWSTHGSEYYECSRYKKNPSVANESSQAKAREALKKYLFYFERWENHAKSLRLEELTMKRIEDHINSKVMHNEGTWIDWQYLLDAGKLLAKARYTLQYTYPYAYYLHEEDRKSLFEHQQAQLEVEIENLSWKIERAVTTDRGDIENQMDIVEKRRKSLLTHFSNN